MGMNFGKIFDKCFGHSWPITLLFTIFVIYFIKNISTLMGDGGLGERCAVMRTELGKAEKEKIEVENNKNQNSNILYQAQQETASIQAEINQLTEAISKLKNWENEF